MSVTWVTAELRRTVFARAAGICEYCLIAASDTLLGCEIDHIVSEKHGGPTSEENLAIACALCNDAKGSDVGSIDQTTGNLIRFFNPRVDRWCENFRLASDMRLEPLTAIGRVTVTIFKFNAPDRLKERWELYRGGRYPSSSAQIILDGYQNRPR